MSEPLKDAIADLLVDLDEYEDDQTPARFKRLKDAIKRVADCADDLGHFDDEDGPW